MGSKRTEQIAVRITPETKKILQEEAKKLDWSPSKLVEKILVSWTENRAQNGGAINFVIHQNSTININNGGNEKV